MVPLPQSAFVRHCTQKPPPLQSVPPLLTQGDPAGRFEAPQVPFVHVLIAQSFGQGGQSEATMHPMPPVDEVLLVDEELLLDDGAQLVSAPHTPEQQSAPERHGRPALRHAGSGLKPTPTPPLPAS
jgi:hypothetical protein